jgi:endonuclease/exonuclease/phosphatase (EEP) superfamily protein YafD
MQKSNSLVLTIVNLGIRLVAVAASGAVILSFFPNKFYVAEVLSHCRLIFIPVLLCILCAVAAFRSRWIATSCLLALLFNVLPVLALYMPVSESLPAERMAPLTLVVANLWGGKNKRYDLAAKTILNENPQIICISEITPIWQKQLNTRFANYPYRIVEPHLGGVAIYSKMPLTKSKVFYVGAIHRPGIIAHVNWNGKDVCLINVHTVTPFKFAQRNEELDDMAERAAAGGDSVILAGDLNCSPWSSYFDELQRKGRLVDTEQGFGATPSWSTHYLTPLIPIDHCLTRGFRCTDRRVLGRLGSDHLPLLVRLQQEPGPPAAEPPSREQ